MNWRNLLTRVLLSTTTTARQGHLDVIFEAFLQTIFCELSLQQSDVAIVVKARQQQQQQLVQVHVSPYNFQTFNS